MAKEEKEKKTKKVKKAKNNKKEVKKEGFFKGIRNELKLVKWPTFKEILKYTIATVIFCIILIIFFQILDLILAYVKGLFN